MRSTIAPTFVLVVVALAGCRQGDAPGGPAPDGAPAVDGAVVARYAGKALTVERALEAMKRLPGPSQAALSSPERRKQFVDHLITNDLLFAEGERAGFTDDPEIRAQVDEFRQRLVVQRVMRDVRQRPEVSDEEAQRHYDANPELYSTTQIRASHILVKDEATAKAIRAELAEHPERFADLAREKSTDLGSGRRGGDLGKFGPGRMVPEFERAAFALEAGKMSDVVQTQYGYHVILVTERTEGTQRPFDQAKAQIKSQLANQRLQKAFDDFMNALKAKANVQIDDAVLATLEPPPADPAAARSNPHAMSH